MELTVVDPQVIRYSERPELWQGIAGLSPEVWPEYNLHGDVLNQYWDPRSMRITGSVADWESWTRMRFPETGDYVFPAGLATVHIDRDHDMGQYWEPNVWLVHRS